MGGGGIPKIDGNTCQKLRFKTSKKINQGRAIGRVVRKF